MTGRSSKFGPVVARGHIVADNGQQNDLQATLLETIRILHSQRVEITAHQQAIAILGQQLLELSADVKITKIAASVLLREMAGHDRLKLDRLIAQSVGRAELDVERFSAPVQSAILSSIDELITLVEVPSAGAHSTEP